MKKSLFALLLPIALFADIDDTCQDLVRQSFLMQDLVYQSLPIDQLYVINTLPYTISQPGKYTIQENLEYSGNSAAITVSANDVSINFHNYSLTSQNGIGILAQNIQEFTVENPSDTSLHLVNVNKGTINNLYSTTKVTIENSSDIELGFSHFTDCEGLFIIDSSHVAVDSCTFHASGIAIQGAAKEVMIQNSSFTNCVNAILAASVEGMVIENCKLTGSTPSQSLIQLGDTAPNCLANDCIIRNSSFIQNELVAGFNGIQVLQGEGCLLESLVVDTATTAGCSAIHINGSYNDLLATSCIIKGNNQYALFIEEGEQITLDKCQLSESVESNIKMVKATSCVVKNCTIFNGNNGVHIDNSSGGGKNSIRNNYIFSNKNCGIIVDDMAENSILNNSVWANATGIQIAFTDYTETLFNTSCNNSLQNCSNVYPNQQPGDATIIPGANLCCD